MKYKVSYKRQQVKRAERVLCHIEREFDSLECAGAYFSRIVDALDLCELSGRIEFVGMDSYSDVWHDTRDGADIVVTLKEAGE